MHTHTASETTAPTSPQRVLVLGASGMIGREVIAAARGASGWQMLPASHRSLPGHVQIDYESLTTPEAWAAVLQTHRVDAVVNCVGIWSGSPETFERVQYTVPTALFDACAQRGLRMVHVSALGFRTDSPLPYVATKARADRYLLANCPTGVVIYPSLVFGPDGNSSRFFMRLAALPVQVDFGFARNLQPVHVREVADAVMLALQAEQPPRSIDCAGTHAITIPEYFDALRRGMGWGPAPIKLRVPQALGRWLFAAGERLGAHFVNRQTWILLAEGTQSDRPHPQALPYERFATRADRWPVREWQLALIARLAMVFLWLWTAAVTVWGWPQAQTLSWLDALWPGLGTPFWLVASALLDAAMGVGSLVWPRKRLWQAQWMLVAIYTVGLAWALPWAWLHPFGPLTKNLTVLVTLGFLWLHHARAEEG
jgi:uncharacterized protein YbjT (DUF2867 family)